MKRLLSLALCFVPLAGHAHPIDPRPAPPLVQLALLLDTSNSMDGLIDQAKSQLWRIVNDLADSQCRGRAPRIEVALYEYGNSSLAAGENYLRQVLPFTNDLDRVSERLFSLRTNGGDEYCGAVIKDAVKNLGWDRRSSTYKTLFIAGNEPFTQGDISFKDAIQGAVARGVLVNTIFCGPRSEGIQTAWKEGAERGRGDYFSIDQDRRITVARTPYDDEIERLGRELNDTYVYYGVGGTAANSRARRADEAALNMAPAGAAVERSLFKSKSQYAQSMAQADAVTGVTAGQMKVSDLKGENLPPELRGMDAKALEAALREKAARREKIQTEISQLDKKRRQHLESQASPSKDTLDQAVLGSVRSQAASKGFTFDNK